MAVNALVGDDRELRRIDRISTLAQDLTLRSLLAAAEQEEPRTCDGPSGAPSRANT
jgi:hypothetical protein